MKEMTIMILKEKDYKYKKLISNNLNVLKREDLEEDHLLPMN